MYANMFEMLLYVLYSTVRVQPRTQVHVCVVSYLGSLHNILLISVYMEAWLVLPGIISSY